MMDWGYMGHGPLMAFGWLVGLLLVIGAVATVVALLRPGGHGQPPASRESVEERSAAEAELELRYVRGEIDASTLVEQRAVLHQG